MPLPDRDPTAGELRIMFENIMTALRDVKETMATKEFVNAKFDSHNERMTRLEEDVKIWVLDSTRVTADLKSDLLDRIRESNQEGEAEHKEINSRIDEIEIAKSELDKQRRARNVAITLSVVGASLSLVVSIASAIIINTLIP
jgi:hypothetical protein